MGCESPIMDMFTKPLAHRLGVKVTHEIDHKSVDERKMIDAGVRHWENFEHMRQRLSIIGVIVIGLFTMLTLSTRLKGGLAKMLSLLLIVLLASLYAIYNSPLVRDQFSAAVQLFVILAYMTCPHQTGQGAAQGVDQPGEISMPTSEEAADDGSSALCGKAEGLLSKVRDMKAPPMSAKEAIEKGSALYRENNTIQHLHGEAAQHHASSSTVRPQSSEGDGNTLSVSWEDVKTFNIITSDERIEQLMNEPATLSAQAAQKHKGVMKSLRERVPSDLDKRTEGQLSEYLLKKCAGVLGRTTGVIGNPKDFVCNVAKSLYDMREDNGSGNIATAIDTVIASTAFQVDVEHACIYYTSLCVSSIEKAATNSIDGKHLIRVCFAKDLENRTSKKPLSANPYKHKRDYIRGLAVYVLFTTDLTKFDEILAAVQEKCEIKGTVRFGDESPSYRSWLLHGTFLDDAYCDEIQQALRNHRPLAEQPPSPIEDID